MPIKSKRAKSRRAKSGMRKRNFQRGQRTTNVNRGLRPFASRYITKMKYSEVFTLSIANNYTQIMNLNSLFDPNSTGVGHQPYGFDQLAAIYNRYRVISTSYVVNAYQGSQAIRYAVMPCNSLPPINNLSELCENPRAKFRVQIPGGSTSVIKGKSYLPALMGRTKSQYMADDRFQAQSTAGPAELALLYISGQSMVDGSLDIQLNVTMEFLVEWFDPNPIDQS